MQLRQKEQQLEHQREQEEKHQQHQQQQEERHQQHQQQQQQLYERLLKYAEAGGRERQRLEVTDLKLTPRLWLNKPAGEGRRTVSDPLTRHD